MPTRYDVTQVPLQGGYVAKSCPVVAQNNTLLPIEPIPPDPFGKKLIDSGRAFEAEIFAELTALHPDALLIEGEGAAREAATLAAMQKQTPLIIAGRLPADEAGRREGRPDLLVLAQGGGYHAIDVKGHQSLEPTNDKRSGLPGRCSQLSAPTLTQAVVDPEFAAKKKEDDLLQLAHYQRMLEALGMAATNGRYAGIIGTERRVVWYDLDQPIFKTPSISEGTKLRTTMERYDFEFAFRLDIIAVAQQHQKDPSVQLLTVPVKIPDCDRCSWWDYCRRQLEKPPGDVSLLPKIGWTQWKIHHDHGVTNRAELAALDWRTASLIANKVDVARLMESVSAYEPTALVDVCSDISEKVIEQLHSFGVMAVGDVVALDKKTAKYSDSGMAALPMHIDLARAALGTAPVYRKRGIETVGIPRADVEVDVDMENTELGCYMWGTYHSTAGYRAFVTWEPLAPEVEAANSLSFWRWLMAQRKQAHDAGQTFAAYCWNAGAENQYLRKLGIANAVTEEVEEFIASDEWVDLLREWDAQLITGHSSGLKEVTPLCGLHWAIDDAGGGNSMVQYELAATDDAAREWLLTYNQGDVGATLAIREWMSSAVIPSIESATAMKPSSGGRAPYSYGSRDVQPGYESQGWAPKKEPWGKDPWGDED